MNHKACILLLSLLFCFTAQAQKLTGVPDTHSYLGGVHTPKGDLHMLLIFVRYDDKKLIKSDKMWPDVTAIGKLPKIAKGDMNALFNTTPESIGSPNQFKNISDLYYQMSGGKFRITADIFPVSVPVKFIKPKGGNHFTRQTQMNQLAIDWIAKNYPDFDWSKYDNRTNTPNYSKDNSESPPDQILDYVMFLHRKHGSIGMGSSGALKIPNSNYLIRHGHTGIESYTDAEHNWEYFKHEFAHNLYSSPHYMGANKADGDKYYVSKGWGLMAGWHTPFFLANAWESWWLGWIEPQTISKNGTYTLKDYATERDAIRIPIPGTQDYLWIENHQKISHWDNKIFFKKEDQPHPAKGIYMYVVAAPGADRSKPRLSPFNPKHCNLFKIMNGEGNHDYVLTGDTVKGQYFPCPVWRKYKPNPIAGQNDLQWIRFDENKDGRINIGAGHGNTDGGSGENTEMWAERVGGLNKYSLNNTGDENDAFGSGSEIGLSGIVPVTNYPIYNKKTQQLGVYRLNGINIKIVESEGGNYRLKIKLDDWEVRKDQRWCGNILVPQQEGNAPELQIKDKVQVLVDLSGTPNRSTKHELTGTFSNPTVLTIDQGRTLRLKTGSEMVVDRLSTLHIKSGGKLIIEPFALLRLKATTKLIIDEGAQVRVESKGKLLAKSAKIEKAKGAKLELLRGAKFKN